MSDSRGFTNSIDDIAHAFAAVAETNVRRPTTVVPTSAPASDPEQFAAEKADPTIAD